MRVRCDSGRVLDVPANHCVFMPVGAARDGQAIDPATVEVEPRNVQLLRAGDLFIVDDTVEAVRSVERVTRDEDIYEARRALLRRFSLAEEMG